MYSSKHCSYKNQYKPNPQAFIEKYSGLVKKVAHHLIGRLPPNVLLEDLIQSGMVGLLEAQQNYDGSKGASFETFASIRIRGAMLDELRRGDWTPRSVHKNNREINQAIFVLEQKLGREPMPEEIAEYLEVDITTYYSMLHDLDSAKIIGVEDLGVSEDVLIPTDSKKNHPFEGVVKDDFKEALVAQIKKLPHREQIILSLYYDEELNLKEIGAILDVSESRISQILTQVTQKLRSRLSTWQD